MVGVVAVLFATAQPVCATAIAAEQLPCDDSHSSVMLACCCESAPPSSMAPQSPSGLWVTGNHAQAGVWLSPASEHPSPVRALIASSRRGRHIPLSILHSSFLI